MLCIINIGIGKDSMGMLILLSVSDRDVRIETGYNMQAYFTDITSGEILDEYGMELFKQDKFSEGLVAVQSATISKIYETVPKDWQTQITNNEKFTINLWPVFWWILGFIILCASGFGIYKLIIKIKEIKNRKLNEEISRVNEEWDKLMFNTKANYEAEKYELENEIDLLKQNNNYLEKEVEKYEENLERIKKLHPNIENEIKKQIEDEYKQSASIWDDEVKSIANISPTKDNANIFEDVLNSYKNLKRKVKQFVKTDIEAIKQKHKTALKLKDIAAAEAVGKLVLECCSKFKEGNHTNYNDILQVYEEYQNLNKAQKDAFPYKEIITDFDNLYKSACEDNDNYKSAKKTEKKIKEILSDIGDSATRHDLRRLKEAKNMYEELSSLQLKYVDKALYEEILRKIKEAKEDEEEYERMLIEEEEEERRRRNDSSSSSGGSFNISFGKGGHSGGGGASRHF